ncbi:MAG: sulfatase-like hydrolase/transferase [Planctomycetota bacterium]|nr:sulfatase-like hydrolase/transferase [Planctomycetota bacterium]
MLAALLLAPLAALDAANPPPAPQPNILVIITDDQGYGELSCHGNPVLKTPNLDRLHDESIRFSDFHVAPMCTPTRGQLMTGVDCLRNRAMNVSSGRTLLRRDLPTMADLFGTVGYATGIFGKWHLGDNYPYRPQDRGFHETLWYPSSHIGSAPDFWDNDYFDDTYWHNGRRRPFHGYTTDVFFRETMRWMRERAQADQRFLCYLPTAAPHAPHFVPASYRDDMEALVAKTNLPKLTPAEREQLTRYLAMIANIDENMGRLDAFLRETGLRDNTVVVFLTDNGSTFGPRYFNAGMLGGRGRPAPANTLEHFPISSVLVPFAPTPIDFPVSPARLPPMSWKIKFLTVIAEEHVGHGFVVMLAGMDECLAQRQAGGLDRLPGREDLHVVGPGAGEEGDSFHVALRLTFKQGKERRWTHGAEAGTPGPRHCVVRLARCDAMSA